MKKVLVVAPHLDDEVFGPAGTIKKHTLSGDTVDIIFVANRVYRHKFDRERYDKEMKCCYKAKDVLWYRNIVFLDFPDEKLYQHLQDIIIKIEDWLKLHQYEIVYIPFYGDNHQDHRTVFDVCRVVFRVDAYSEVKRILMYEVLSSTEQFPSVSPFLPNYYVDITDTMEKKIEASRAYTTESRLVPHPRAEARIYTLAGKRGGESEFAHAEAFVLLKERVSMIRKGVKK